MVMFLSLIVFSLLMEHEPELMLTTSPADEAPIAPFIAEVMSPLHVMLRVAADAEMGIAKAKPMKQIATEATPRLVFASFTSFPPGQREYASHEVVIVGQRIQADRVVIVAAVGGWGLLRVT